MNKDKYYIFDCDDNLIELGSLVILVDKKTGDKVFLTSTEYSRACIDGTIFSYEPLEGDWTKAFVEFSDTHTEHNRFAQAISQALGGGHSPLRPSISALLKCLYEASPFAVVTARGHSRDNLMSGVKLLIEMAFESHLQAIQGRWHEMGYHSTLDQHLKDSCFFVGISSPEYLKDVELDGGMGSKYDAIHRAVEFFVSMRGSGPASVGFSDDHCGHIDTATELFAVKLSKDYPNFKFCIYDTSDGGYVKRVVHDPNYFKLSNK